MFKVLLVDDEVMARTGLRETFDWQANGFELIGEAANGQRALAFLADHEIDVLITDIAMPVMDGLELMRLTKQLCPWVKVILLSCHSDYSYLREGIRLGASDYLLKALMEPEDLSRVLLEVRTQLQNEPRKALINDNLHDRHLRLVDQSTTGEGEHRRLVQQAMAYIHDHFQESIGLQDLADEVCMSKNYFSELFKRETGMNYIDYLIQCRIEHAKKLFTQTSLRVYEIAEQSGFKDVKHFSKLFKKVVGHTPVTYRRQVVKEHK